MRRELRTAIVLDPDINGINGFIVAASHMLLISGNRVTFNHNLFSILFSKKIRTKYRKLCLVNKESYQLLLQMIHCVKFIMIHDNLT